MNEGYIWIIGSNFVCVGSVIIRSQENEFCARINQRSSSGFGIEFGRTRHDCLKRFEELDTDHDLLIDPNEAERAR